MSVVRAESVPAWGRSNRAYSGRFRGAFQLVSASPRAEAYVRRDVFHSRLPAIRRAWSECLLCDSVRQNETNTTIPTGHKTFVHAA